MELFFSRCPLTVIQSEAPNGEAPQIVPTLLLTELPRFCQEANKAPISPVET